MNTMNLNNFRNRRGAKILLVLFAGFCLFRALTANADDADVEDYLREQEAPTGESSSWFGSSENDSEEGRAEIRLTRPDEAEDRIAYDKGYKKVPGFENIKRAERERELAEAQRQMQEQQIQLQVPVKKDSKVATRRIASESATPPTQQLPTSEPMQPAATQPTHTAPIPNQAVSGSASGAVQVPKPVRTSILEGLTAPLMGESKNPLPSKTPLNPGVQEISVIVSDYGFFPKRIFVTQNIPVRIYLSTSAKNTMCFMMDQWGVRKGVVPGKVEEVTFTPDQAGTFRFYCPVRSIEGHVTVREVPIAPAPLPTAPARSVATQACEDPDGCF